MKFTTILVCSIVLISCVSKKKFYQQETALAKTQAINDLFEDTLKTLKKDTLMYGIKYRNLMWDKNFLEEKSKNEKEYFSEELNKREQELETQQQELREKEKKVKELRSALDKKDSLMNAIKDKLSEALISFKSDELTLSSKDGKLYVSLSEKLLFKSGSATVDAKGKEAIAKLSEILAKYPDLSILVEGHTDNVQLKPGKFTDNWDLSSTRAISIVKILLGNHDLDPKRITAAGRSEYNPLVSNDTPEGRAINRRTEIILTPKLDELLNMIKE